MQAATSFARASGEASFSLKYTSCARTRPPGWAARPRRTASTRRGSGTSAHLQPRPMIRDPARPQGGVLARAGFRGYTVWYDSSRRSQGAGRHPQGLSGRREPRARRRGHLFPEGNAIRVERVVSPDALRAGWPATAWSRRWRRTVRTSVGADGRPRTDLLSRFVGGPAVPGRSFPRRAPRTTGHEAGAADHELDQPGRGVLHHPSGGGSEEAETTLALLRPMLALDAVTPERVWQRRASRRCIPSRTGMPLRSPRRRRTVPSCLPAIRR